jgi:hypothetical protein
VTANAGRGSVGRLLALWTRLHPEQRVAAVAAILLIVSTLGPFSFVEAAEILAAGAVLALLKQRAEGREFHLPLGDGTVIFGAGVWCGVLIATRMFDRPPGLSVLALVCALLLAAAGLRERAKRAPDDLPERFDHGVVAVPVRPVDRTPVAAVPARRRPLRKKPKVARDDSAATRQLTFDEDATLALGDERQPDDPAAP